MHALIELIASLIAALAATAFAQFGIDLQHRVKEQPEEREVHRTVSAQAPGGDGGLVAKPASEEC